MELERGTKVLDVDGTEEREIGWNLRWELCRIGADP